MKKFIILLLCSSILPKLWSQSCDTDEYKGPQYYDTYHEYYNNQSKWAHFNVHDPSMYKDGEYYYMYNTDVGMGYTTPPGAMKRRSKDLVNWEFLGRAFEGVPKSARDFFKIYNPSYTDAGIWAPFLTKYKNEYRLYYSAPGGLEGQNLAFIGWATSNSANGPWEDKGKITTSIPGDTINAIDPTVITDSLTGQHWMAYGSYQRGIYVLELDSLTGGLKTSGDRGVRIAARTGGRHAAIEGPELNYHNGWYYLFVSYDWLEDYYNVRVGRSRFPNGPYYDFNGLNMSDYSDNMPMIEAPYKFKDSEGWQGTAHCGVYNDKGKYYMVNQARPTTSIYNMVLHVREIFWIDDWPVVSPERYAAVPNCTINADSLVGKWEYLKLILQKTIRSSSYIEFSADGTISNSPDDTWILQDSLLTLSWDNGQKIEKHIVFRAWDWENKCLTTAFTGIDNTGLCYWGKKVNQEAIDKFTILIPGAAYTIRNHYSNMLMELPNGKDVNGTGIKQGNDIFDSTQIWRLLDADNGYVKIVSMGSATGKVLEVENGNDVNGAKIRLWTNEGNDKQRFKIFYNNNGYFRILTKISSIGKCIDLNNFSIVEGGEMIQWEYLNGLNQAWRFTRVDTIAVDTNDNVTPTGISTTNAMELPLHIFPNPNSSGKFTIDASAIGTNKIFSFAIYNNCGLEILSDAGLKDEIYDFDLNLGSGLYLIKINLGASIYTEKLIVY